MAEHDDCDHDFDRIGEGHYDGMRPGWTYDEFFCRRCLLRVAVEHETGRRHDNPDPSWFHRKVQR